ncbi:MAG: ATP-binding protein [Cyanobacteria bacterium J06623_4]
MENRSFYGVNVFRSRLSRQIVLWIFGSILVIEGIILVPAVSRRRREAALRLEEKALASVRTLAIAQALATEKSSASWLPAEWLEDEAMNRQFMLSAIESSLEMAAVPIVGGALYSRTGAPTGAFGESVTLFPDPQVPTQATTGGNETVSMHHSANGIQAAWLGGNRYEIFLSAALLNWPCSMVLRYDATAINQDIYAFIRRIIGLVILISAFVTLTTFWVLQQLIISPLQRIRHQLALAVAAETTQDFYLSPRASAANRRDELDDVIDAFNQRTAQLEVQIDSTQQALAKLKDAQAQLVQSEKMSSLGQLVAGIAHEINNPASFIHGNLHHIDSYFEEMMSFVQRVRSHSTISDTTDQRSQPLPAQFCADEADDLDLDFIESDWTKLLHSMRSGTQRIQSIVLSLRNFARLDEADFKAVDLHEGLDSAILLLNNRLLQSHPPITVRRAYGQLPAVICYPGALNQVFLQLLNNAIDAVMQQADKENNEEGGDNSEKIASDDYCPTISVCTTAQSDSVLITIEDNGTGIDVETQSKMFDPFFTTKPVGEGTGMGLAVCYQIVEGRHQGKLRCQSTPGKGTKLIIELPLMQQQD